MTRRLGLDLGGTNVKAVVLEEDEVAWQGQLETEADRGPAHVVERLATLGRRAIDATGTVASVGITVPGAYDAERGVALVLPNVPGDWERQPLVAPLSNELGARGTLINDARAFALAESRLGAGRGASTSLYVVLGTGVGGGIVIDGRLHLGLAGSAGEIGHVTADPDGPVCGCGAQGCVEAFAGANAIEAAAGKATAEEAAEAAEAGDERALEAFRRAGRALGIGIASAIHLVAPDRVVIGGGVARAGEILLGPMREEVRAHVRVIPLTRIGIVGAELDVIAGAIGAALWGAEAA